MNTVTNAHELADLALEAAPHLDLLTRAAPHLQLLLGAAAALRDWSQIEAELVWAASAPEHMRPDAHRMVFDRLARLHGSNAEFWGALAYSVRTGNGNPTVPAQGTPEPVASTEVGTVRPMSPARQAMYAAQRLSPAVIQERAELLRYCCEQIGQLSGTRDQQRLALLELGVQIDSESYRKLATGAYLRPNKGTSPPAIARIKDILAGLELLIVPSVTEGQPPVPPQVQPTPQPDMPPHNLRHVRNEQRRERSAPSPAARERERIIAGMLLAGNGRIQPSAVGKRLGLHYGAAIGVLNSIDGLKKYGPDDYRSVPEARR